MEHLDQLKDALSSLERKQNTYYMIGIMITLLSGTGDLFGWKDKKLSEVEYGTANLRRCFLFGLLVLGIFCALTGHSYEQDITQTQRSITIIEYQNKLDTTNNKIDSGFNNQDSLSKAHYSDIAGRLEKSLEELKSITEKSENIYKNSENLVYPITPMTVKLMYSITISKADFNSRFGGLKFKRAWYSGDDLKIVNESFKEFMFSPFKSMNFSKDKDNMSLSPQDYGRIIIANLPKYNKEEIEFMINFLKDSVTVNIGTKIFNVNILNADFSGVFSTKDLYGWYFNFVIAAPTDMRIKFWECRIYTGLNQIERLHFFNLKTFPSYQGGGFQTSVKISRRELNPYFDEP